MAYTLDAARLEVQVGAETSTYLEDLIAALNSKLNASVNPATGCRLYFLH